MQGNRLHYGWVVAVGCGLMLFYSIGMVSNVFSVFLNPLMQELALTKTQGSLVASVQSGFGVIFMIVGGFLYSRFSIRYVSALCGLLIPAGYLLFFFAHTLPLCFLAASMTGSGYGACSMVPTSIILTRWFNRKRGTALALASACTGLATIVFPPWLTLLIEGPGLRTAFLFQCISSFLLVVLTFSLIRDFPKDKGLLPYGADGGANDERARKGLSGGMGFSNALKDRRFYISALAVFLLGMTLAPTLSHLVPYLVSQGFTAIFASVMISVYGGLLLCGKLLYGMVSDRLGNYVGNYYIFFFWLSALAVSFLVGEYSFAVYLLVLMMGLGMPMGTMGIPLWTADLFGTESYPQIVTCLKVLFTVGGTTGMILPGLIFDATGSYQPVFGLYFALVACSLLLLQFQYRSASHQME